MRLRAWIVLLLVPLLLSACERLFPPARPASAGDLEWLPKKIQVGLARVGERVFHDVPLRNRTEETLFVELAAGEPFTVEPERFLLDPGEAMVLRLGFAPTEPGPVDSALGVVLLDDVEQIRLLGEGERVCDPVCGLLHDGACAPIREGETCAPSTACGGLGVCNAGTCVREPAAEGTPCAAACGAGVCVEGACLAAGGALEPAWTFSRNGGAYLLDANEERLVLLVHTDDEEGRPGILLLDTEGLPLSLSVDHWSGARVVGDRLLVHREKVLYGFGLDGSDPWTVRCQTGLHDRIVGSTLYCFLAASGDLAAIDTGNGSRLWSTAADELLDQAWGARGDGSFTQMAVGGHSVFFHRSDTERHLVLALDAATGAVRWIHEGALPLQVLLPDGAGGFVGATNAWREGIGFEGALFAVDSDGSLRWSLPAEGSDTTHPTPLRILGDRILLANTNRAIDLQTGAFRYELPVTSAWTALFEEAGSAVVTLESDCEETFCRQATGWESLTAFDAAHGAIRWERPLRIEHLTGLLVAGEEHVQLGVEVEGEQRLCTFDAAADNAGALVREVLLGRREAAREEAHRVGDLWLLRAYDQVRKRTTLRAWRLEGQGDSR